MGVNLAPTGGQSSSILKPEMCPHELTCQWHFDSDRHECVHTVSAASSELVNAVSDFKGRRLGVNIAVRNANECIVQLVYSRFVQRRGNVPSMTHQQTCVRRKRECCICILAAKAVAGM